MTHSLPFHPPPADVAALARRAGRAILPYYGAAGEVTRKDDHSPVTEADRLSQEMILQGLKTLTPTIPIIAEEDAHAPPALAPDASFWLVDPLDGTRSFVRGTGEFVVCIGLVTAERAVLGAVYAPLSDTVYYAAPGTGAWRKTGEGAPERIRTRAQPAGGMVAALSHAHAHAATEAWLADYRVAEKRPAASALKFCWVAEGTVDCYPRLGPTMEWDTAAGQAIVEEAGGRVTDLNGAPLRYGKTGFRNESFVAWG